MSVKYHQVGNPSPTPLNVGGNKQVFEAPTRKIFLAKEGFSFADLAAFQAESNWDAAIAAKNIVPLPEIDTLEAANIDQATKDGRYQKYVLKDGQEGWNLGIAASMKTYAALKSYQDSEYTRAFQITNDDEVTCDVQADGTIKGRDLSSYTVGQRVGAKDDDTPMVTVSVIFEEDTCSFIKPSFDVSDKEAVFEVGIEIVSASSTEIKCKVSDTFTGFPVSTLADGDLAVKDASGGAQSITFANDGSGAYTLTGTGFTTGFTVATNGVVSQSGTHYESESATSITVS